jgi:threonine dehydratase
MERDERRERGGPTTPAGGGSRGPAGGSPGMADAAATPSHEEMAAHLEDARRRIAAVAHRTPVATSRALDERVGARVFLKCENLQRAGAFKFRGAYNLISRIPADIRGRGVVAYSSGNHAQAVALVARLLGIPAVIVMPSFAARPKLEATRGYGAEVIFYDRLGESREGLAVRLAAERGMTLVPPFDHHEIVAGQGTAACELFEEVAPLDRLLVPLGGGGLLSGSALAARVLCPGCRVIGVEPAAGDDGARSFRSGRIERVEHPDTIADGARTPSLGNLTFALIRRYVTDVVTVPDDELIRALRFVMERMKLVVEPTAVLGLAALLSGAVQAGGERVGVVLSGGNLDFSRAREWFGE